jgi:hypothetical protein
MTTTDRLEFRFLWNAAEHRRFYNALRRAVWLRGSVRWLYLVLFVFVAITIASDLRSHGSSPAVVALVAAPYVIVGGMWFAFVRWGMPYLGARSYERNHRACIPHDQVRVVSADGIEARCVTSDVKVQWHGISRVLETRAEQLAVVRELAGRHSHIEQSPHITQ